MANRAEKTNPLQASLRQARFFSANPARGIIRAHPRYPWLIPLNTLPASGLLSNKLVAEAFYLTGNIEKYGSGFIRIRKALEDYPEVRLEISESGYGLLLSFLKVDFQPESQPESQPEFKLEQRVMALLQTQALGKKQISEVNQKY
jgi:predicted HTH transcriptional regulator